MPRNLPRFAPFLLLPPWRSRGDGSGVGRRWRRCAKSIYDKVSPSLVAVQFTYVGRDRVSARLHVVPGIVVSDSWAW